jgi:hypothetical protein
MRFHRRPEDAVARLGYDSTELANVPLSVTSSFAGVGNPHAIAPIHEAARLPRRAHRRPIDCFSGTTKERTARRYGIGGVNLVATRA